MWKAIPVHDKHHCVRLYQDHNIFLRTEWLATLSVAFAKYWEKRLSIVKRVKTSEREHCMASLEFSKYLDGVQMLSVVQHMSLRYLYLSSPESSKQRMLAHI